MGDVSVFIIWLLVLAVFLQVDFIFYIVYVVVGIYGLAVWYTPWSLRRLKITRRLNDHAFLGERVAVELSLENKTRFPLPWIQVTDSIPVMLQVGGVPRYAFGLAGRSTASFHYQVQATRRGYYRLGPLRLTSGDFFGFNESRAEFPVAYLTVYPRITPITRLSLPSRLPYGIIRSRQRLFEDPARPVGVREYTTGDSLRRVNWKVSAHAAHNDQNLMVKTLEPAISLDTAILLNLDRYDYQRKTVYRDTEWAIEAAASLAAHLTGRQQAVGLITNGRDPLHRRQTGGQELDFDEESGRLLSHPAHYAMAMPVAPRTGRTHLMSILEILARVEMNEDASFTTWAPGACLHLSWGITILALTAKGDEATCQMLHQLVRAGYNPALLIVDATTNFGQVRERARRLGFRAYHLTGRDDLEKIA
jgi:hypothetical protein